MTAKWTLAIVLGTVLSGCIYSPRYDHDYPRRRPAYRVETTPPPAAEPSPRAKESSDRDDWSMNERGGVKTAPARESTEPPVERVYYAEEYYPVRTYYHYDPWPYWYGGWGWGWHSSWHYHRRCHPHWGFGIHWHLR